MTQHRYDEAEEAARPIYEVQSRVLGPDHPETVYSLQLVGTSLVYRHRYPEAVRLYQAALKAQGDATGQEGRWRGWYSFACVASVAGRTDDALEYLQEAIKRGYKDADGLMNEDNFKILRQDSRFQELVAALRRPHN